MGHMHKSFLTVMDNLLMEDPQTRQVKVDGIQQTKPIKLLQEELVDMDREMVNGYLENRTIRGADSHLFFLTKRSILAAEHYGRQLKNKPRDIVIRNQLLRAEKRS